MRRFSNRLRKFSNQVRKFFEPNAQVFEPNAQVLKWARQKCAKRGKKFAKARDFWAKICQKYAFLNIFDFKTCANCSKRTILAVFSSWFIVHREIRHRLTKIFKFAVFDFVVIIGRATSIVFNFEFLVLSWFWVSDKRVLGSPLRYEKQLRNSRSWLVARSS